MKNLKYIVVFFFCNIIINHVVAQQDTINRIKIISVSESDTLKSNPPAPDLNKEVQALREEVNALKTNSRVVVVQKPNTPKTPIVRQTVVGLNMTTMLSRLVPFGNGIPLSGPTSIMLRRYRDNRAFRMGIGLNASNDSENLNATIRIGTERKKDLNSSFTFLRGVDFLLAAGSFNTPGFRFNSSSAGAIGAALTFGLEYNLNKNISIGTEALIFGGIATDSSSGFSMKIVPPIALYLNARLF